ncbi:MAG TPA: capsule assembly Wzi family protein [Paludibacter sp.]|nr:capsule assembly Wzi family protein [Paludibacter sp.]
MKHRFILLLLCTMLSLVASAQTDSIQYDVSMSARTASGSSAPFWFQNNQFGVIPFEPNSSTLLARVFKSKSASKKTFDYNFVASGYVNIGRKESSIKLHELYINTRLWIFNASAGMHEEILGNQDESLSCGGFLFSWNSRPMPKLFIGIEDFKPLLFKNGFVETKGGVSHGWFADQIYTKNLLLHHKYVYLRFGGNKSPFHIQYGLDHVAQWGGTTPPPPTGYGKQPSGLKDYINVFLARSGSSAATIGDQINVGGNHIISQSTKAELNTGNFEISAYWQNLSEDKPIRFIWKTPNISDGLWGFSVRNKKIPFIKKVVYEYLNTTDQTGPYHDVDGIVFGGGDSYFYNYLYQNGWTYYGRTIGTPFITSPVYNKNNEISVMNNRVQVHHVGVEGEYKDYNFKALGSFTKNYGTYFSYPNQDMISSTNMLFELNKHFEKFYQINAGIALGVDVGEMYGNNLGISVRISKRGCLFPPLKERNK